MDRGLKVTWTPAMELEAPLEWTRGLAVLATLGNPRRSVVPDFPAYPAALGESDRVGEIPAEARDRTDHAAEAAKLANSMVAARRRL